MSCDLCKLDKNPLFGITRNDKDYFICNECWPNREAVVNGVYRNLD